jgi:hypothetical protein
LHEATLPTAHRRAGSSIDFTIFWPDDSRWENHDYRIDIR